MGGCVWKVRPEDRLCKFCKLTHCWDRDYRGSRKYGTVTPTMRGLDVGGKAVFSADKYGAVRTAMTRLAPKRFSMFYVGDRVKVERIS
jgi:hypothetical protein